MSELPVDQTRLARAAAALRERSEQGRRAAVGGADGQAGAYWSVRRGHLRRLKASVGEATLESAGTDVRRADATPGAHRVRHRGAACDPRLPTAEVATRTLLGCLELVSGIGPVTARRLRAEGVLGLEDLLGQDPHAREAAEVIGEWERRDLPATCARLTRRLGGHGHLLSALLCTAVAPEEIAFLDLETMGLWNNTVFLAGIGSLSGGAMHVEQFLAPGHADEPAVVAGAVARLAEARVVVTFNGRSADLPWLAGRAFYYGLGPFPAPAHVDLLHGTRRRYQRDEDRLGSVRLPEVSAELLEVERPAQDVPSWMVPEVYDYYSKAPAAREGLLLPILEHNRADLVALAGLLELLCAEAVAGAALQPR